MHGYIAVLFIFCCSKKTLQGHLREIEDEFGGFNYDEFDSETSNLAKMYEECGVLTDKVNDWMCNCTMGYFAFLLQSWLLHAFVFRLEKKGRKKICLSFPDCSEVKRLLIEIQRTFSSCSLAFRNDERWDWCFTW